MHQNTEATSVDLGTLSFYCNRTTRKQIFSRYNIQGGYAKPMQLLRDQQIILHGAEN